MDNSIYVALSRQLAQFRDLEVTANNLANVSTTGYQGEKVTFDDYLVRQKDGNKIAFANDIRSYRDITQGAFKATGNELDAAIQGPGFFSVQTPQGVRYTRNGSFTLNADGELMTAEGYKVLDTGNQPVALDTQSGPIRITENGSIIVGTNEVTQLNIVEFADKDDLNREGSNLFSTQQAALPAERSSVKSGVLESSNVQPVMELTHLTKLSRSVDSTAKFIEAMYELQRKTGQTYAGNGNG